MAEALDGILVAVGIWLHVYGFFLTPRRRFWIEVLTSAACGMSIVCIAPLVGNQSNWTVPILFVFGMWGGSCAPCCPPLFLNLSGCTVFFSLIWQSGLYNVASVFGDVASDYTAFIWVALIPSVYILWATPYGQHVWMPFIVPMWGSLLLVEGLAGLVPEVKGIKAVPLEGILDSAPYDKSTGNILINVAVWLVLTVVGTVVQHKSEYLKLVQEEEQRSNKSKVAGGDLISSLLPGAVDDENPGGLIAARLDEGDGAKRHRALCTAMYSKEGDDISFLTAHEQKLVILCRDNEFERDRILWGGGLL